MDDESEHLRLSDYPQLQLLGWSCPTVEFVSDEIAFAWYQRNWRFIDEPTLTPNERQLIDRLALKFGGLL